MLPSYGLDAHCRSVAPRSRDRLAQRIFALESTADRVAATLVLWPLVRECATALVRKASFELGRHHNAHADQVFVLVVHAFGALTTRFLLYNMNSVASAAGVIAGQALVELALRQPVQ